MHSRRTLLLTRWLMVAGALAGIVLLYRRWLHVNQTTVALSLLLLVLVLASEWGLRYAVVCSLVAAAVYNFFFLPPYNTFTIADTQNWIALFAFLATSIVASRLAHKVRNEAEAAKRRQRELDTLYRLSRELFQSEGYAALIATLPATVMGVTGARSCGLYLIDGERLYQAGGSTITDIELPHLAQLASSLSSTRRDSDNLQIPLRSGVRPRGVLILETPELSIATGDGAAGLISLALDRAQALEALARGDAAKESERLRTLMMDSITHELRTPLTSIKGAATSLMASDRTSDNASELLSIINEESDRLNRLVSEAVEMSRLDAHDVQMRMEPVPVEELIEKANHACAWVNTQHPVETRITPGLRIKVDPTFFEKALSNLLSNGAKYSAREAPIVISAFAQSGQVMISIADQGIGIDESEQTLIFERFYRSLSQSAAAPGTGMGLAISRAIIRAHGGEIAVVSQIGKGSVFTLTLPEA